MKNNTRKITSIIAAILLSVSATSCNMNDSHAVSTPDKSEKSPSRESSSEAAERSLKSSNNAASDTPAITFDDTRTSIFHHNVPNPKTITEDPVIELSWTDVYGQNWNWSLQISADAYNYAISHETFIVQNSRKTGYDLSSYLNDAYDMEIFERIIDSIINAGDELGYSDLQDLGMIIGLVRSFETIEDKDEDGYDIIRYPVETLYRRKGNILSKLLLANKLFKSFGLTDLFTFQNNDYVYFAIPLDEFEIPGASVIQINNKFYCLVKI